MKKAMLLFVSLLLSAGVNAASFDFNVGPAEERAGTVGNPLEFTESGLTLTATATGPQTEYAYLDAGDAGLGVCTVITGSAQCNPASDDNATGLEKLILTFSEAVSLPSVDFKDANHGTTFTGDLLVENMTSGVFGVFALAANLDFTSLGKGLVFAFSIFDPQNNNDEFYINALNAEVPVPAALFLFAPALLGFFGLRRKATLAA